MKRARPLLQQVLGGPRRWRLLGCVGAMLALATPLLAGQAGQSFAMALPELEGPITLGIFSSQGDLVRLLHCDADVGSIPAGLNGLIMNWDGKDDLGRDVPAGTYKARGLVHGPVTVSAMPVCAPRSLPSDQADPGDLSRACVRPLALGSSAQLFGRLPRTPSNMITLRAARDELLETRPLLAVTAAREGSLCVVRVEGLPLISLPLEANKPPDSVTLALASGSRSGTAVLTMCGSDGKDSFTITGLDRLVPLNAGALEISKDAFHPTPVAGESVP